MTSQLIRLRVETLLHERGLLWKDVYKKLGWHKSFASRVLNGIIIPLLAQRVALAQLLTVDTSVIWDETVLLNAYEQDITSKESLK